MKQSGGLEGGGGGGVMLAGEVGIEGRWLSGVPEDTNFLMG